MGKVAREVVEKSGINVEQLLKKLVAAAGAEFTTFYYYTILRVASIGMEGEGMKEIIEDARIEDRNHFEALVPRIYELGGELPRDIRGVRRRGRLPGRLPPRQPERREVAHRWIAEGLANGSGRGRALCDPLLHGPVPVHTGQRPPHLRDQCRHPERGNRARGLVLRIHRRGAIGPLPPRQAGGLALCGAVHDRGSWLSQIP